MLYRITFLWLIIGALTLFSCSKDDDPQIKNLKVCTELSGNSCESHEGTISPTESAIYTSAELESIENANVTIALWAWDGSDWIQLTQVTINNEDKNIVNATFTNQNPWPETDYEIEYTVDTDPELVSTVMFTIES
ncbi:MAG: hypothetical protein R3275_00065 [Saprospiraceae bacterium]|nr:hypothetical protein [Saprospiraceae bacterium]